MKQSDQSKEYTFDEILKDRGYLVYTNVGVSMMPLLRQRKDIIEIRSKDPGVRCKRYDAVLYKRGDKYILHRILKVRPNDYVICGDNNIRREYGITDEMILGVMVRVIRNGKSIYPTDWEYRLYVHLWCDFFYVRAAILCARKIIAVVFNRLKSLKDCMRQIRTKWII